MNWKMAWKEIEVWSVKNPVEYIPRQYLRIHWGDTFPEDEQRENHCRCIIRQEVPRILVLLKGSWDWDGIPRAFRSSKQNRRNWQDAVTGKGINGFRTARMVVWEVGKRKQEENFQNSEYLSESADFIYVQSGRSAGFCRMSVRRYDQQENMSWEFIIL